MPGIATSSAQSLCTHTQSVRCSDIGNTVSDPSPLWQPTAEAFGRSIIRYRGVEACRELVSEELPTHVECIGVLRDGEVNASAGPGNDAEVSDWEMVATAVLTKMETRKVDQRSNKSTWMN
ncbi:hypothetical protein L917_15881 [Phytophthora nicotianae]|uniref:Uncharacterized protein n=1 Tax=Phytophthora nicotianae TaxID=4792 RepID=W2KHZ6_PHYNI|nr:hypothetical protein L917_15881 [Phytophthora nicotianae]